jgi:hypothetical protein
MSQVVRRALREYVKAGAVVMVAAAAIFTLGACGSEAPATSTVAGRTPVVAATSAPVASSETASEAQDVEERAAAGECVSMTLDSAEGDALKAAFHTWGMIDDPAEKIATAQGLLDSIPTASEGCEDGDAATFQWLRDSINVVLATLQTEG